AEMKSIISVRDLEDMVRKGQDVRSVPAEAILTPSARNFLRDLEGSETFKSGDKGSVQPGEKLQPPSKLLSSKSPKRELEALFNSPYCHDLKLQICDVGRR